MATGAGSSGEITNVELSKREPRRSQAADRAAELTRSDCSCLHVWTKFVNTPLPGER